MRGGKSRQRHPAPPDSLSFSGDGRAEGNAKRSMTMHGEQPAWAELQVVSNFTFLTGASHPGELVQRAAELGHAAVALTDVNSLAGIVRAHVAAKQAGIQLLVGCQIEFSDDGGEGGEGGGEAEASSELRRVLLYPTDRAAYGRLCQLLTLGRRCAPKGECHLRLADVLAHHEGLLAVAVPPRGGPDDALSRVLSRLKETFTDDRLSLAACLHYDGRDRRRLRALADLSEAGGVPLVAVNDVHYHDRGRRRLQDVLTCIRHGCTLDTAGYRLFPNAQRCLKPPRSMARMFAGRPDAVARTVAIARRCAGFSLDQLRYEYPHETCPPGRTPIGHLAALTWQGAAQRYPAGVPARVAAQIEHELALIDELDYAGYFLTVHDIVCFARHCGILCQGRGAAANSAVCYCLFITAVDPDRVEVLFERFVSRERNEPPDIDVDFEHERREEVIQYIYRRYGRHRAALTAEVITYRPRSAVREVGKALGLSLDAVDRLARNLDWFDAESLHRPQRLRELGFDPGDPTIGHLLELAGDILTFPRHLSQHVGGFVVTQSPLCELVPIQNAAMADRTVIEWDKQDIEAMGMLKVDVLGLGMLTCIRKCLELVNAGRGPSSGPPLSFDNLPAEDPAVYDMLCEADTVGVFQVESRAQMSMLPRLRPRCYYDLVIEVAIVRPGPIHGKMVHPYLRRRSGQEPVTFPDDRIRSVLGKTLGVPLFQEQVMALSVVAAGFTPGEADNLRRAIAAWKHKEKVIEDFGRRIVAGMVANGYDPAFAQGCYEQIRGFGEYGFPESHAASFALIVYASAWLKRYHPAAFACALLNSQPMGFYAPAQIVRDAREHGVEVRPVDVNASAWDCTLEAGGDDAPPPAAPALRLGQRMVRGLRQDEADRIAAAVAAHGPFATLRGLWRAAGVRIATLRRLAGADAFNSMGLDRQSALWHVRELRDSELPIFDQAEAEKQDRSPPPSSSPLPPGEGSGVRESSDEPCASALTPALSRREREPERLAIFRADGQAVSGDTHRSNEVPAAPPPAGSTVYRPIALPPIPLLQKVMQDYAATGLSLKAHPVSFLRPMLDRRGMVPNAQLRDEARCPAGATVAVSGIVLVRQRPGSARGVIFMTIEDETGVANLILRPRIFDRFRRAARHAVMLIARGRIERQGRVVHVMVQRLEELADRRRGPATRSRDFH